MIESQRVNSQIRQGQISFVEFQPDVAYKQDSQQHFVQFMVGKIRMKPRRAGNSETWINQGLLEAMFRLFVPFTHFGT